MLRPRINPTVDSVGTKIWLDEGGSFHRDDGPAKIYLDGSEEWWLHGNLHRENGPALTEFEMITEWYSYGTIHRDDGPAVTHFYGTKEWIIRGNPHREDGPAVVHPDGTINWWLRNREYSFTEWCDKLELPKQRRMELALRYMSENITCQ